MIKRYTLHDLRYIFIGRVGERNALTVDIDLSGWLSMFPDGDLELRLSLPDGSVFVPDIERTADGHLLWTVGETETAEAGNIAAQLVLLSDGVIAMTFVFECDVLPSGVPVRPVTHVTPPITDIRLTDSDAEADYYTITCADGSTFSFMVRNGKDGKNGVTPQVELIPDEDGYLLRVTTGGTVSEYRLDPVLLDAATLTQTLGSRTDRAPSEYAVHTALEAHRGGWTDEQIDLFEDSVDSLETALGTPANPGAAFVTEEAATAAVTSIAFFRDLIESLRETPTPPTPDVVVTVSGGKISTNANTLTVSDGKIKLEV